MPFQPVGKQKRGGNTECKREHRLQVDQVVGAGVFLQHEQPVDIGVDQGLWRGVMLENGKHVFAVLGFRRIGVEFELCAFKQQQRSAQFRHGVLEFRVRDGI
ncbi:hypothetical protein D9M71_756660 [compost metagenome]